MQVDSGDLVEKKWKNMKIEAEQYGGGGGGRCGGRGNNDS